MSEVFHHGLVFIVVIASSMALVGCLIWNCIVRLNDEPWLRHVFSVDEDGPSQT